MVGVVGRSRGAGQDIADRSRTGHRCRGGRRGAGCRARLCPLPLHRVRSRSRSRFPSVPLPPSLSAPQPRLFANSEPRLSSAATTACSSSRAPPSRRLGREGEAAIARGTIGTMNPLAIADVPWRARICRGSATAGWLELRMGAAERAKRRSLGAPFDRCSRSRSHPAAPPSRGLRRVRQYPCSTRTMMKSAVRASGAKASRARRRSSRASIARP